MDNRRNFLRLSALGLAVATTGLPTAAVSPEAPSSEDLFHPLGVGSPLGLGWALERSESPAAGAMTLTLAHEGGRKAWVEVRKREGEPKGPAWTGNLDFLVMNGSRGGQPMDEGLGRALRVLASQAARNEPQSLHTLAGLTPHASTHQTDSDV